VTRDVEGSTSLDEGVTRDVEGSTSLDEGATRDVEGSTKLGEGVTTDVEGSTKLGEGVTRDVEGSTRLDEGMTRDVEGSTSLDEAVTKDVEGLTPFDGARQCGAPARPRVVHQNFSSSVASTGHSQPERLRMKSALAWVALAVTCVACGRSVHKDVSTAAPVTAAASPEPAATAPGTSVAGGDAPGAAPGAASAAGPDYTIAAPKTFGNLTIFPVLSKKQEDIGPITTLEAALAKGVASVHEIGAGSSPNADSAQVGSLVIENRGAVPVYVLAGTIVKGGKQDRQIGQDFIVGANQTVPVDAFCVEHGRWTTNREGVATGGQFGVVGLLTDSRVRAAAEHDKDQGQVWAKVEQVNEANKKQAASGTLLASVDSADIVAKRTGLAKQAETFLSAVQPGDDVVGFAYAVDGKVRSARWFTHHKVFDLFRGALVGTAAMEAITAQAEAAASGQPAAPLQAVAPAAVTRFIDDAQASKVKEERATPGLNVNEIRDSKDAYSSATKYKAPASAPRAAPKPVSTSITKL
jgi:hypothetical protein